jgi:glucose-6-phosphate-specific signal transduction histidine kinase
MKSGNVAQFFWPDFGNTVAIAALVLAVAVIVFGIFSGARANKLRVIFAVILATALGWLVMPLAVAALGAVGLAGTQSGIVVLVSVMLLFVAYLATSIYEIITVSISDVGMASNK